MFDLQTLLETEYKPEFPELLAPYEMLIVKEHEDSDAWEGNICRIREDSDDQHYLAISYVYNEGQGGANQYLPIVMDTFARFNAIARKCYPTVLDPMDFACVYLELREAVRDWGED